MEISYYPLLTWRIFIWPLGIPVDEAGKALWLSDPNKLYMIVVELDIIGVALQM